MTIHRMKLKQTAAGAAGLVLAASLAAITTDELAAQTSTDSTTTSSTDSTKTKTKAKVKTEATPAMICEAVQRSKARFAKFLADGTPEEFGSEEPFTFDPSQC